MADVTMQDLRVAFYVMTHGGESVPVFFCPKEEEPTSAVSRNEMDELIRGYVCSNCWSNLTFKLISGSEMWHVFCPNCKGETRGYVTKKFAKYAREKSISEFVEASINLRDALGLRTKSSSGKNLKELGF